MAASLCCPDDDALWPALDGDLAEADVRLHLLGCSCCRRRVRKLQTELREIRKFAVGAAEIRDSQRPRRGSHPEKIGRYPVLRRLGRGAQADVFLALHPTLGREVVVKWARTAVASWGELREDVEREARMLAAVSHPCLARVLDLDFHGRRPFLVLEYAEGRTLAEAAGERPLAAHEIAKVMAGVAQGVHAAHEAGMLHLDLKPENVIVVRDGTVRVIDFGIAALLRAQRATAARWIVGTPGWMAPEQEAGDPSAFSVRTDVHGLGALLQFLLQRGPHERRPQSPLRRVSEFLNRTASQRRRLSRIAQCALARRPEQRFPTAIRLAEEIERVAAADASDGFWLKVAAGLLIAAGVWLAAWASQQGPLADYDERSDSPIQWHVSVCDGAEVLRRAPRI
jgi:serine/threonine protein kinase